jgi:Fur family ferric uptake transcriptional regulator
MQKEVKQFCDFLKKKELKLTPQRVRIAETVFSAHKHFTAEQLYAWVKKVEPLVGKVTVYRTLEQLVESGMVDEFSLKKGVSTYEHVAGHDHHDHLLCVRCGKIEELSSPKLEKLKRDEAEKRGYEVISHTLKIYGLCPDCRKG